MTTLERTLEATADPPPRGVPNPIHEADGADAAGYAGALVAGIRTYGWAADVITDALGEKWLSDGWIDFSLRRPLYAGEALRIVVAHEDDDWRVTCHAGEATESRVVLDGKAGLGTAPFLAELDPPPMRAPAAQPAELPSYDLDHVPLGEPLNPLAVHLTSAAARALAADDLRLDNVRYLDPAIEPAFVTPYFLAGRMSPLTRHNFVYGPTIHVRSQIQHCREARADRDITVGARIVDAWDRNGHWYQALDGRVTDETGDLAIIRHHTIFRPRGT